MGAKKYTASKAANTNLSLLFWHHFPPIEKALYCRINHAIEKKKGSERERERYELKTKLWLDFPSS